MPTVSLKGIDSNPTLLADSLTRGTDEGKPVKFSDNLTVALCSDGDDFVGIVEAIDPDNAVCVVRDHGYVTVPYTGSAPSVGYGILSANGAGGVKTDSAGRSYYIGNVDTVNATVTFKLE